MFLWTRRAPHHRSDLPPARRRNAPVDGALQSNGRSGEANVNLVELAALEVGYNGEAVLPPVHLDVTAGAAIGIVGPNGSGKTTLVRTMLGLLPPIRGSIRFPRGKR